MRIDQQDVKVSFDFSPRHYFLVYDKDYRFGNGFDGDGKPLMTWTLNPRIDMSYKGKDDQVAIPVLYLSDKEAEQCKEAGFTWIDESDSEIKSHPN